MMSSVHEHQDLMLFFLDPRPTFSKESWNGL